VLALPDQRPLTFLGTGQGIEVVGHPQERRQILRWLGEDHGRRGVRPRGTGAGHLFGGQEVRDAVLGPLIAELHPGQRPVHQARPIGKLGFQKRVSRLELWRRNEPVAGEREEAGGHGGKGLTPSSDPAKPRQPERRPGDSRSVQDHSSMR
jgi:hypothetical protein